MQPPLETRTGSATALPPPPLDREAVDETERRRRARQARKAGRQPAEEEVTLGGSKQRRHLPASASHEEKLQARQAGKRPSRH